MNRRLNRLEPRRCSAGKTNIANGQNQEMGSKNVPKDAAKNTRKTARTHRGAPPSIHTTKTHKM